MPPVPTPATNAVGVRPSVSELRGDLGAGGFVVRLHVGGVVELLRAEHAPRLARELVGHADGAEESAELGGHGNHRGAETLDDQHALARHPVRHVDAHRVAERAADRGEGDAGVAARGLGDHVARRDLAARVRALQDVQRHAVLDAAGEVVRLVFGVDAVLVAAVAAVDFEQRRAADEACERDEFGGGNRRWTCGRILPYARRAPLDAAMKNIVADVRHACIQRAQADVFPTSFINLTLFKGTHHANPQTLPGGGRRRGDAAIRALSASSHREAPNITRMPTLDSTDFYLFNSYEPGRDGYVTLLANYIPLQAPVRWS